MLPTKISRSQKSCGLSELVRSIAVESCFPTRNRKYVRLIYEKYVLDQRLRSHAELGDNLAQKKECFFGIHSLCQERILLIKCLSHANQANS